MSPLYLVLLQIISAQVARAITGLEIQEVTIVDASTLDGTQDEIVCSLTSIEPQNSDSVFRKYLITQDQNDYIVIDWVKDDTATDIETCATNAQTAQARMFLFNNEGECFTSADKRYERLEEPCLEDQTKLVFMDDTLDMADDCSDGLQIMAANLVTVKKQLYCEVEWMETCTNGSIVQSLETIVGHTCSPTTNIGNHHIYRSGVFFSPTGQFDHAQAEAKCTLKDALVCAPADERKQEQFIKDLLEYNAKTPRENMMVGLSSLSPSYDYFEWITGVKLESPDTSPDNWATVPSTPYVSAPCVFINDDSKFFASSCLQSAVTDVCCYRPL